MIKIIIPFFAALSLVGCGVHNQAKDSYLDIKSKTENDLLAVADYQIKSNWTDKPIFAGKAFASYRLPAIFSEPVSFKRKLPISVDSFSNLIKSLTNINVYFRDFDDSKNVSVSSSGTLQDILNHYAAANRAVWAYENNTIVFKGMVRESFALDVLPGDINSSGTLKSSTDGLNTSTDFDTSYTQQMSFYNEFVESARGMLSEKGSLLAHESTTSIVVKDYPDIVDDIRSLVMDVNSRMTQQIVLDLTVHAIDYEDKENHGLNLNLAWSSNADLAANIASSSGNSLIESGLNTFSVFDSNSNFSGSNAIVDALATLGKTTHSESLPIVTLSHQPVTVIYGNNKKVVEKVESVLVPDVGIRYTATATDSLDGLSVSIFPMVSSSGDILIQTRYSNSRRSEGVERLELGDSFLQLSEYDFDKIQFRNKLKNGQTLVLAGLDRDFTNYQEKGQGDSSFWLAGGGKSSSVMKRALVFVITARIVE